jgi:TM2 domain-containing membrane protein YozV
MPFNRHPFNPGLDSGMSTGNPAAMNNGQGSAGNVIASLASFLIPGLGQLIQGRLLPAILFFVFSGILWFFLLGWIIHLWACLDAALWKPRF